MAKRFQNLLRGFLMEPILYRPPSKRVYLRYRSIEPVMTNQGWKVFVWGDIVFDPIRATFVGRHRGGAVWVTFGRDFGQRLPTILPQHGESTTLAPAKANGGLQIRTYLELRPTPMLLWSAGTSVSIVLPG